MKFQGQIKALPIAMQEVNLFAFEKKSFR